MLTLLGIVFALCSSRAGAQIKSNPAAVNLNAVLNTGITITAAPGLVNFTLVRNGTATGSVARQHHDQLEASAHLRQHRGVRLLYQPRGRADGWGQRQHPFGERVRELQRRSLYCLYGRESARRRKQHHPFQSVLFHSFYESGNAHRYAEFANQYDGIESAGRDVYRRFAHSSAGELARRRQEIFGPSSKNT